MTVSSGVHLLGEDYTKVRLTKTGRVSINLKQAARILIYLQENGIDSCEDLVKKSNSHINRF
jgi:hypothetical protein